LIGKPALSSVDLAESPLGANVPVGQPADRRDYVAASRKMLKPDTDGIYTVKAVVSYGTTETNITQKIYVGRYLGYTDGCRSCHSGGSGSAPNMSSFTNTPHADAFARRIDGDNPSFASRCISCHVVGFDSAPGAVNGGFDDVMVETGWTFPTVLTNGNYAAMPAALRNVSNIQCESCHGPGSQHLFSEGKVGNPAAVPVSLSSAVCGQCHDSKSKHYKNAEWANSGHSIATSAPSGPGRTGCVSCHTGAGFVAKTKGVAQANLPVAYEPIGCATCHDPHSEEHHAQLRVAGDVTLMNGHKIENAGSGAICMDCHHSRRDAASYVETTPGGSTFGPHHSNQADMLAGSNGYTYGKDIASSAHSSSVEDSCVHCHMQTVASTDPAFTLAGGHTFKVGVETSTNHIMLTQACTSCHGDIEEFNLPRQDYDGNGVVEGVQTEVQNLLDKLAYLLPPVGPKSDISITSSWTKQQLKAGYNYRFVHDDGSYGVHNAAYAVGLLRASIADMTGDSNQDGLPDEWQIQYFGSATAPEAAPDATPAGDGVPNWLKYSLGLDPKVSGVTVPGGVVWANAGKTGGSTEDIQIYTAAEVAFDTEVGKTYQLQSISSVNEQWSNVGAPIVGDGQARSLVTPTRNSPTQFFRVVVQ